MNYKVVFLYLLFIVIFCFELDFAVLGIEEYPRKALLIIAFCVTLFNLSIFKFKIPSFIFKVPSFHLFLIFIVFILCSYFWSIDPLSTITGVFGLLVLLIVVVIIVSYFSHHKVCEVYLNTAFSIVIISLLLLLIGSDLVINTKDIFFRFKGIMNHSQRYSVFLVTTIIILYHCRDTYKSPFYYFFMFVCLLSLVLTFTRSFTVLFVFLFIYILFKDRKITVTHMILVLPFLAFCFYLFDGVGYIEDFIFRDDRDIYELSGRTAVWEESIYLGKLKPFTGYGFGSFRTSNIGPQGWVPEHAHNMWIHQFYEIGYIGLFIFTLFLVICFYQSYRLRKENGKQFVFFLLLFYTLSNITGVVYGGLITPFYFYVFIFHFKEQTEFLSINKI